MSNNDMDALALNKLQEQCAKWKHEFFSVPNITVPQLQELQKSNPSVVLVDVRSREEQQVSVLPGNTVSAEEFERHADQYKDRTVVCYCTAGLRSSKFASKLRQQNIDARNLEGSILAWTHAGLPLVTGTDDKQPTQRLHAYSGSWAQMAHSGYETVVFKHATARAVVDTLKGAFTR